MTPPDIREYFLTTPDPGTVIEVDAGPDKWGRYEFSLYWLAEIRGDDSRYTPDVVVGSKGIRGQCFLAEPRQYEPFGAEFDRRHKSAR